MGMYMAYDKNTGHPLHTETIVISDNYDSIKYEGMKEKVIEALRQEFPKADPDLLDMLESDEDNE